ncbi:MAG: hypothetical protein IJ506_08655 [Clostridia bacterium]|nr:hypothetical protein [Clostridia bacterium]
MFNFLSGSVTKLNIKKAVDSAKNAICAYFKLKDQSICTINIDKSGDMGHVEARYGKNSYFRIFFCNPLNKGDLPVMTAYYGVKCARPSDEKMAKCNGATFTCAYAPYGNELQVIHTEQMIRNEMVERVVREFFQSLFNEQKKKVIRDVSSDIDL